MTKRNHDHTKQDCRGIDTERRVNGLIISYSRAKRHKTHVGIMVSEPASFYVDSGARPFSDGRPFAILKRHW